MDVVTREDAHAKGLKRYFTGVACKYGHLAERYVSTNGCVGCLGKFGKMPPNPITKELAPWQPSIQYIPHDMLPQLQDTLNDVITKAVIDWCGDMGMVTLQRLAGWKARAFAVENQRKLRDFQIANRGK